MFSTSTMLARRGLNITLYVQCLSCAYYIDWLLGC